MKNVLDFSCAYRRFSKPWWKDRLSWATYIYPLKFAWQRVTRGWADCDTWSLDNYLCSWLPEAIEHLRDTTHGYPACLATDVHALVLDDNGDDPGFREWKVILTRIAEGFRAHDRTDSTYEDVLGPYDGSDERYKAVRKLIARDQKAFREGMRLFTKHFASLWD